MATTNDYAFSEATEHNREDEEIANDKYHESDVEVTDELRHESYNREVEKSGPGHDSPIISEGARSNDGSGNVDEEKGAVAPTESEEHDPNIVWWDGPNDPANPLNWGSLHRVSTIAIVSTLCLLTPLASSMFAPGVPQLMQEFGSDNEELAGFVVSIYILGFAFGPLIMSPASELYGRLPVYHVSNIGFLVFTIACALSPNLGSLVIFRFLAGCFGAAPLTIGGGTIADVTEQKNRGKAMSFFVIGPLFGPVIGPIAGGFLSDAKGWRWVFWILAMCSGVSIIGCFIFFRETYAPVILQKRTKKLQKETGNMELRSKLDTGLSPKVLFWRSIIRPTKMLLTSSIILGLSLYMGIVYGYLYLLFTTFTVVFEVQYGFSSSTVGLSFLGLGIGNMLGLAVFGVVSDKIIARQAIITTQPDGTTKSYTKPEARLPPAIPAAFLLPIGYLIYGWTADYRVNMYVPIFGTLVIGLSNIIMFMAIQTYMVDAFTLYAASALAANTVIRCILGAVLPLAGQPMNAALGLGWGNTLLAGIAIFCIPLPFLFLRYGERLRKNFKVEGL